MPTQAGVRAPVLRGLPNFPTVALLFTRKRGGALVGNFVQMGLSDMHNISFAPAIGDAR